MARPTMPVPRTAILHGFLQGAGGQADRSVCMARTLADRSVYSQGRVGVHVLPHRRSARARADPRRPRSRSSTRTASAAWGSTGSSRSPASPRRPSTSTSPPRTTSCSPTSTGSTRPGPGSSTRRPRRRAPTRPRSWWALFDALGNACRRDGYRGCAFINAAAENPAGSRIHDRTLAHKEAVRSWLTGLADEAGAADPPAWPAPSPCCWTADWPAAPSTPSPTPRSRPAPRRPRSSPGPPPADRSRRRAQVLLEPPAGVGVAVVVLDLDVARSRGRARRPAPCRGRCPAAPRGAPRARRPRLERGQQAPGQACSARRRVDVHPLDLADVGRQQAHATAGDGLVAAPADQPRALAAARAGRASPRRPSRG